MAGDVLMRPYCYPGAKRLAAAAKIAGFTDAELPHAVGISGQETSGNVWAIGGPNKNGSYDFGAWQINLAVHSVKYPEWVKTGDPKALNWMSYVDNAKMARQVYLDAGSTFRPWYAFTQNRYNTRKAPFHHSPGHSWLDWAQAGIAAMHQDIRTGRKIELVASIYFA